MQAVINLTDAGALQAFDALSGEVHGSVQTMIVDDSRYIRQAVLGRLRQAPYAGETGAIAALGCGGPVLAYGAFRYGLSTLAYADARRPTFRSRPRRSRRLFKRRTSPSGHRASAPGARSTATAMPPT